MSLKISYGELKSLYESQGLTTYKIAEKFGCCQATVWNRLHKYGIKPRWPWNAVFLTKKELEDWYVGKRLSTWEIEKQFGHARSTVYRKLKEFKITTRNIASSHVVNSRYNFSGDLVEKAYIIGFSLGDLNVSKRGLQSETVVIKCGTTKYAQILLFKEIFDKYGKIWEGKPTKTGRINGQANLNLSFSFLLKKRKLLDKWIVGNKKYFLSFLAGFSDAEGSFFINNRNQAVFSVGNYNKRILLQIKSKLDRMDVKTPKVSTHYRKGCLSSSGYIWNGDYFILHCSKKKYLLRLIGLLKPYVKHQQKISDMERARENIVRRSL